MKVVTCGPPYVDEWAVTFGTAMMRLGVTCCRALSGWVAGRPSRSCIVSKRLMILPQLLWNANRKPYPSFRMVLFSMTFL